MPDVLAQALLAPGPSAALGPKLDLYGWLCGRWHLDAEIVMSDGTQFKGPGSIHAGWVLEGRALQDVWRVPGVFFGTTLRLYDPQIDAWHIMWSDPVRQVYSHQIGRADGADIVQTGTQTNGAELRWRFSDITGDAFTWTGERSTNGGKSFTRYALYRATRVRAAA